MLRFRVLHWGDISDRPGVLNAGRLQRGSQKSSFLDAGLWALILLLGENLACWPTMDSDNRALLLFREAAVASWPHISQEAQHPCLTDSQASEKETFDSILLCLAYLTICSVLMDPVAVAWVRISFLLKAVPCPALQRGHT